MANVLVDETYLGDVADSIRAKNGTQDTYMPSQMANAIDAIPSSGSATLDSKTITQNGTYTATDDNLDGYDEVTVNVSGSAVLGTKSITTNGTYNASDDSLDGFSAVTVNVSDGLPSLPSGYRQVEYIEMTPNSYATLSNVELTTDDNILLRYERASDAGTSSQSFFSMGTYFTFYFSGYYTYISAYGKCRNRMSLSEEIIDGLHQFCGAVTETLQGNVNIGCYNRTKEFFKGKAGIIAVYTQVETLVYDYSIFLIPCVRISDNAVGFYDAIGDEFYTNQGSGSFTAGPYVA